MWPNTFISDVQRFPFYYKQPCKVDVILHHLVYLVCTVCLAETVPVYTSALATYIIIPWNKIAWICLSGRLLDLSVKEGDGGGGSRAEAACTFPSWDGWPWQIAGCNVSNALYAVLTADYPRGLRWEAHVIGAEQSQDPGQTVMCQCTATDPWLGHEHGQDATLWRTLRTALHYISPS